MVPGDVRYTQSMSSAAAGGGCVVIKASYCNQTGRNNIVPNTTYGGSGAKVMLVL